MSRTVKPETIKTLSDWVKRWPKATNLGFDAETREATVYSQDPARTRVGSFPWVREGDVMTILCQPSQFGEQAVAAARSRYERIRAEREQELTALAEQLREQEQTLLTAWRNYHAASPADRPALMRDCLTAERMLREIEAAMAPPNRALVLEKSGASVYVPPMDPARRPISLTAVAEESA